MRNRTYFLLTAVSGMVGMLSLISVSLTRFWISQNPIHTLSDDGIDQLLVIVSISGIATMVSQISVVAFIIFLILYLTSRSPISPRDSPPQDQATPF